MDIPTDLWVPITAEIRPVTSDIVSAGACYGGLKGWEFSLEGYYKKTDNVLEYVDGRLALSSSVNWEDNVAMGEGRAYGLELYARKVVGKTTGTLATPSPKRRESSVTAASTMAAGSLLSSTGGT